jgi:hypothetical protein
MGLDGGPGPSGVAGEHTALAISSSRFFFFRSAKSFRDIFTLGGGGDSSRMGSIGSESTFIGSACDTSFESEANGDETLSIASLSITAGLARGVLFLVLISDDIDVNDHDIDIPVRWENHPFVHHSIGVRVDQDTAIAAQGFWNVPRIPSAGLEVTNSTGRGTSNEGVSFCGCTCKGLDGL